MPRDSIPFSSPDTSSLAKSLRSQLAGRTSPPSHVEMLNMLARAAGHRNFQHFRAQRGSISAPLPEPSPPADDDAAVERAARYFDASGRMTNWPAKTSLQSLCLWAVWARLPAGRVLTEREVSDRLKQLHLFDDHAIIRRTLCNLGLLDRTVDGREYRRVERAPTPAAAALIARLGRPAVAAGRVP